MKKSLLMTSMLAIGLTVSSCASEEPHVPAQNQMDEVGRTLSFNLKMPSGDKVSYTRADGDPIHDESEWTINRLALYEYEVLSDGSEKLLRIIKSDGKGTQVLNTIHEAVNKYTVSITVPDDYLTRNFKYRFVANDTTEDPALESAFETIAGGSEDGSDLIGLRSFKAARLFEESDSADKLSNEGIAMSGIAKDGSNETITMTEGMTCSVEMQRIVSRVDIRYATPNLKVTHVELRNAPTYGFLFDQNGDGTAPEIDTSDCLTLAHNINVSLPTDFLKDLLDEKGEPMKQMNLNRIFYLYERANKENDVAIIHIEYDIDYNNKTEEVPIDDEGNTETRPVYYHGSIDVPFKTKDGFVDALRNHRYTIVLGNGDKPVSGSIQAAFVVNDWNDVAINEELTSQDPERK